MEFITEPGRKTPIARRADVVVVGGGPAGIGAAIQAGRSGADTVIIERFGTFGGTNTTGYMFVSPTGKFCTGISREIFNALESEGYAVDLLKKYPKIFSNPLAHYVESIVMNVDELHAYNPDMCSYVISEMVEKAGAEPVLRSLFVDAKVEDGTIKAVIVENASGRQAIEGKVFIDATGRGDVVARAGAPYVSAQDPMGFPMPCGLMWRMADVDYQRLFEYQKKDPELLELVEKAQAKGELPYYRRKKTREEMEGSYVLIYTGHSTIEMMPTAHPGEMLLWTPSIHEWGINAAEKVEDVTRAEIHIRKQIMSELSFMKKYVPGFEKAYISGIAPFLGIREGRHPVGEYVLTLQDIKNDRKFDDAALRRQTFAAIPLGEEQYVHKEFEIPYRSFLAKKVENLLLSGDIISAEHDAFAHIRTFANSVALGEVAGTAAALSVKNKVTPKELKWAGPL